MAAPAQTDAIVNRHMARLLTELEEAGCPALFRDAVKSKLAWLRDDLRATADDRTTDATERNGNGRHDRQA